MQSREIEFPCSHTLGSILNAPPTWLGGHWGPTVQSKTLPETILPEAFASKNKKLL